MFILVTGGSGSGKSGYAEECMLSFGERRRFYVATMKCFDQESRERVKRHRQMRCGKGFETLEQPLHLEEIRIPAGSDVLLECMSNLTANEMFDPEGAGQEVIASVCRGIDHVLQQCDNLVVVTNEVFSDGMKYEKMTEEYLAALGKINTFMGKRADRVFEVVYGIPVPLKG